MVLAGRHHPPADGTSQRAAWLPAGGSRQAAGFSWCSPGARSQHRRCRWHRVLLPYFNVFLRGASSLSPPRQAVCGRIVYVHAQCVCALCVCAHVLCICVCVCMCVVHMRVLRVCACCVCECVCCACVCAGRHSVLVSLGGSHESHLGGLLCGHDSPCRKAKPIMSPQSTSKRKRRYSADGRREDPAGPREVRATLPVLPGTRLERAGL